MQLIWVVTDKLCVYSCGHVIFRPAGMFITCFKNDIGIYVLMTLVHGIFLDENSSETS